MGTSELKPSSTRPYCTNSPAETKRVAALFASQCRPNDVVGLKGSLGAGKTCFVKGLARGLGVEPIHQVTSPTFVLHQRYAGNLVVHHFDAYRLESAASMVELGCDEVFSGGGVSVVEWADHVMECLPDSHFMWEFRITGARERQLTLLANGSASENRLTRIEEVLEAEF